ncbi:MAG: hypothetical protein IJU76_11500 [Desulfovibrionaceae bacterium]|nr:hypothetical protein [Desulfovibrionaceae bacterium]
MTSRLLAQEMALQRGEFYAGLPDFRGKEIASLTALYRKVPEFALILLISG